MGTFETDLREGQTAAVFMDSLYISLHDLCPVNGFPGQYSAVMIDREMALLVRHLESSGEADTTRLLFDDHERSNRVLLGKG